MHNIDVYLHMLRESERTLEKWYPCGTDIFRHSLPSVVEPASTGMVTVSAEDRLLRRRNDFDFGAGGWTPFNSKVASIGSLMFKSRIRITLLFVSAINNFPEIHCGNYTKQLKCILKCY